MSVKFQSNLIVNEIQYRRRPVFEVCSLLRSQGRGFCSAIVAVFFAGTISAFMNSDFTVLSTTNAAEILQHQNQAELSKKNELPTTNPECPTNAALTKIKSVNIETLLSDLDPASKRAIEAVPTLVSALRSSATPTLQRERIAMVLGRIGEPARGAVPILVGWLGLPESNSNAQGISKQSNLRYRAMKSLCLFGPVAADAVPAVRTILTSRNTSPPLRLLAADTLGQLRNPAAIGVLIRQLSKPRRNNSHEETVLRRTMIDGLALAGAQAVGALPALSRATEDSNAGVRRAACQAIGSLGPRAEGALTPLLERLVLDDDEPVKDAAAEALAKLGPVAIPALTGLLERGDFGLQWRAVKSLGKIGPRARDVVPQLQWATQSADSQVRIEAADALLLVSRDPNLVATMLVKELSTDDRQIRRRATKILVSIKRLPVGIAEKLRELAEANNANAARAATYILRERSRQTDQ